MGLRCRYYILFVMVYILEAVKFSKVYVGFDAVVFVGRERVGRSRAEEVFVRVGVVVLGVRVGGL